MREAVQHFGAAAWPFDKAAMDTARAAAEKKAEAGEAESRGSKRTHEGRLSLCCDASQGQWGMPGRSGHARGVDDSPLRHRRSRRLGCAQGRRLGCARARRRTGSLRSRASTSRRGASLPRRSSLPRSASPKPRLSPWRPRPKPDARRPTPDIRHPKPATRNPQPATLSPELV
eukprot:3098722-Rhodomonas_salina.1